MNIQWFPGHIAKARKEIKANLKFVDLVIEIVDARCPISSANFLSNEINGKKLLMILNKADLADEKQSERHKKLYEANEDKNIILIDSRDNTIQKLVDKKVEKICKDIIESDKNKGILKTLIKAMVVGMPNVGKSTFINSYVKKKVNIVANIPGVTKDLKWTKVSDKLLLLDTPGVTVPKFKSELVSTNLALVGAINDDIIEKQELAFTFIDRMKEKYFDLFKERYKLTETDEKSMTLYIMDEIAKNTACLKKGNEIDYYKVSNLIINEFRKGLIGRISLE